jgi:hypothetical protein
MYATLLSRTIFLNHVFNDIFLITDMPEKIFLPGISEYSSIKKYDDKKLNIF